VKTVAIVQSSYIPWKGYFDLIHAADEFILYDDVQFTRRDWRNRNRIKTREGARWLTIPVETRGHYLAPIRDIRTSDPSWPRRHLDTIRHNYARAPYFRDAEAWLEELYLGAMPSSLSEINLRFLTGCCERLGITTPLRPSGLDGTVEGRTEKLVALCKRAGADRYLSGPSARAYLDEALFAREGIQVVYADYAGYPEYPQRFPPFDHQVSIIDLVLNVGLEAPRFMKTFDDVAAFVSPSSGP
jgi:hypothetical protein